MSNNDIHVLRSALFAQIEALQDPDKSLEKEIKRAEAINAVSEQIINSAKVECAFMTAMQGAKAMPANSFIPIQSPSKE